jgi:hypothetical protein
MFLKLRISGAPFEGERDANIGHSGRRPVGRERARGLAGRPVRYEGNQHVDRRKNRRGRQFLPCRLSAEPRTAAPNQADEALSLITERSAFILEATGKTLRGKGNANGIVIGSRAEVGQAATAVDQLGYPVGRDQRNDQQPVQ